MKKIIMFLIFTFFSTNIFAKDFNHIVVFGDSASDDGNFYQLVKGSLPGFPPYFKGRFSNGPTWAERVGKYFYDKNSTSYKIYAYGGATATNINPLEVLRLESEITEYLKDIVKPSIDETLFMIWIGINDYLNDLNTDMETITDNVVASIMLQTQRLVDAGAKRVMIVNIPDLTRGPFGKREPQRVGRIEKLFNLHNQKINRAVINAQKQNPDVKYEIFDINAFWKDFLGDIEKYNRTYGVNIKNTDESCLKVGENITQKAKKAAIANLTTATLDVTSTTSIADTRCSNPNEYVFWDIIHPTEVSHYVISKIVIEILDNDAPKKP